METINNVPIFHMIRILIGLEKRYDYVNIMVDSKKSKIVFIPCSENSELPFDKSLKITDQNIPDLI